MPILNGMAHSKSWHISKGIIKTIMVDEIVLKLCYSLLFYSLNCLCIFSVTPLCNIFLQCINIIHVSYVICDSISILVNDILFCSFLAERSG